jgi:copper(I)-binding protein
MKKVVLLAALLSLSAPAFADVSVSVTNAWARPTIGSVLTSAIYLDVKNNGDKPVELASAEASVGTAALHESMEHEGMMHMQALESVKVSPGETVSFVPGHKHIMLEGLKAPLKEGDTVKLTLKFKEGSVTADVPVTSKAAPDAKAEHHH